jgi:Cu-Zn family superoxide dismutase
MIPIILLILIEFTNSVILGPQTAICIMKTAFGEKKGVAIFRQSAPNAATIVEAKFIGLTPNTKRGFHIQEIGDFSQYCMSTGGHYNPFGKHHGNRNDTDRHIGDLGNINVNADGKSYLKYADSLLELRGDYSIVGRTCTLHSDEDDLGRGHAGDSSRNGHAGGRFACGIIGIAKNNITLDSVSFEDDTHFHDTGSGW